MSKQTEIGKLSKKHLNKRLAEVEKQMQQPIALWENVRPVLFVPLERTMAHANLTFPAFWRIAATGVPLMHQAYSRTDLVRNKAALRLLSSNYTHIVMLDIDHIHPGTIVHDLCKWVLMYPELKVVGGLNFRRGEPFDPCCFIKGTDGKYYPPIEWDDGLIKVDMIGTGSIIISREVFEQIEPPWFYNDYSKVMLDVWPGEDMGFSELCNKAGIDLWVDTTLTSPHLIDSAVDRSSFDEYIKDKNLEVIEVHDGVAEV
jgi:hypothetical protein